MLEQYMLSSQSAVRHIRLVDFESDFGTCTKM